MANTPSFLLDRLRRDVSVQTVAANLNGWQVGSVLRGILMSPPRDVLGIVTAYVYLVAFSYSDPQDAGLWAEFGKLDLSSLEWGDIIRSLIVTESVPTNTVDFSAGGDPCP